MYRQTDFDIATAVSAISAAPDPKACSRIFRKAIAAFNIDTFACGEVDLTALERTVFYAVGWPDAFRKVCLETGLLQRDPLLESLKGHPAPLTWSELRKDQKLLAFGSKAFRVFGENGWTEGVAMPIPRGNERFGLVSMACRRRVFHDGEKPLLAMLSHRLRNLAPEHGFAIPPVGLTKREIDALRLIARGATDRDIAHKLGISPSTAHEYFEKAKRKLKVSTRAEAVAIAVSLAIVAP